MNVTKVPPKFIDQVLQEHDALRHKVRRIHSVLAEPEPSPEEIESLLHEFLSALVIHFSNEEEDEGLFAEVAAHAPRLAGQAGKLSNEHRQLLRDVDEICRFAVAGSPSMPWWRELRSRCHELTKRLMRHEHDETKLLQDAHQVDIGAYD
jgi:iron-sulfur cluster repair protein YtfE (RIC family)